MLFSMRLFCTGAKSPYPVSPAEQPDDGGVRVPSQVILLWRIVVFWLMRIPLK
jgi:hypothetical protein